MVTRSIWHLLEMLSCRQISEVVVACSSKCRISLPHCDIFQETSLSKQGACLLQSSCPAFSRNKTLVSSHSFHSNMVFHKFQSEITTFSTPSGRENFTKQFHVDLACEQANLARNESLQQSWGYFNHGDIFDCQINKMLNKLKSMQKSNKFKASLSSFEEIRMLDVKLN